MYRIEQLPKCVCVYIYVCTGGVWAFIIGAAEKEEAWIFARKSSRINRFFVFFCSAYELIIYTRGVFSYMCIYMLVYAKGRLFNASCIPAGI